MSPAFQEEGKHNTFKKQSRQRAWERVVGGGGGEGRGIQRPTAPEAMARSVDWRPTLQQWQVTGLFKQGETSSEMILKRMLASHKE